MLDRERERQRPPGQREVPAEGSEAVKNGTFEKMSGCQSGWHSCNKGINRRMRTDLVGPL